MSIGQDKKVTSLPLLKAATAMTINRECASLVVLISALMLLVGESELNVFLVAKPHLKLDVA